MHYAIAGCILKKTSATSSSVSTSCEGIIRQSKSQQRAKLIFYFCFTKTSVVNRLGIIKTVNHQDLNSKVEWWRAYLISSRLRISYWQYVIIKIRDVCVVYKYVSWRGKKALNWSFGVEIIALTNNKQTIKSISKGSIDFEIDFRRQWHGQSRLVICSVAFMRQRVPLERPIMSEPLIPARLFNLISHYNDSPDRLPQISASNGTHSLGRPDIRIRSLARGVDLGSRSIFRPQDEWDRMNHTSQLRITPDHPIKRSHADEPSRANFTWF